MVINVNLQLLKEKEITVNQFFILLYYYLQNKETLAFTFSWEEVVKLSKLGFLVIYSINSKSVGLTSKSQTLINKVLGQKIADVQNLASQMRELFPKGIKPGANQSWRGSVSCLVGKLNTFFRKYGNDWTTQEVLNATQRYVDNFGDDMRFMQTLKYFIEKDGESTLLSYLEEPDLGVASETDWTSTMN